MAGASPLECYLAFPPHQRHTVCASVTGLLAAKTGEPSVKHIGVVVRPSALGTKSSWAVGETTKRT